MVIHLRNLKPERADDEMFFHGPYSKKKKKNALNSDNY